jgi:uncharacterized protein YcfJ
MKLVLAFLVAATALPAAAEITLYSGESFDGRYISFNDGERNLNRENFNDRASSAIVRGGRYEVCEDADFHGRCVVLRPGQYPSLAAMGISGRVSSVRAVGANVTYNDDRYAPPPRYAYDYRKREGERLYQADVTSVRAVYANGGEQRCWVERQDVPANDRNVGGAVAGAVIGGILGHQVGNGRGNDAATVGGAVVGGLLGSQVGNTYQSRDVQRCHTVQGHPQYWDVTYNFRGSERYAQLTSPPGQTITVNETGEPRG